MSRNTLQTALLFVVAAFIAVAGALAIYRDRGPSDEAIDATPTASPTATPVATAEPLPTPLEETPAARSPTPSGTPAPTRTPRPSATPKASSTPRPRPETISCADPAQQNLCSPQESMTVKDGKLDTRTSSAVIPRADFPSFGMNATPLRKDGNPAAKGDEVGTLKIVFRIVNDTRKTFFFPEGEIALKLAKDGKSIDAPAVKQGPFDMKPGASLEATYAIPIAADGKYDWHGETWYYET